MDILHATSTSFHDKEIAGTFYDKANERLTLTFANKEELVFNGILQFELSFFSDQNVLFDIEKFTVSNMPEELVEEYPFLKSYKNYTHHPVVIYHLQASVGLSGIVISKA